MNGKSRNSSPINIQGSFCQESPKNHHLSSGSLAPQLETSVARVPLSILLSNRMTERPKNLKKGHDSWPRSTLGRCEESRDWEALLTHVDYRPMWWLYVPPVYPSIANMLSLSRSLNLERWLNRPPWIWGEVHISIWPIRSRNMFYRFVGDR